MNKKHVFSALLLAGAGSLYAPSVFGCPAGIPPGSPGCIPPTNSASPLYSGYGVSYRPRPIWAHRWGAIAMDKARGVVGAVTGKESRRKARKGAEEDCRAKGGVECVSKIEYRNQCGVMIWGLNKFLMASGVTIEHAIELGMPACVAEDTDCQVYYSGCSLPERIR